VAEIRRLDPDILALQEVGYNMVGDLKGALSDLYPYRVVRLNGGRASLAVLSKHPLTEPEQQADPYGCMCQPVTVFVDGQPVTVINVHMWSPALQFRYGRRGQFYRTPRLTGFDTRTQDRAFDQLLERVDAVERPLLVLGDFNTTESQPNYRRLDERLDNAHAAVGWGPGHTWPNGIDWWGWHVPPAIRIDHIFYSDGWQPRAIRTGSLAGSDHRYVIAEFALNGR
jgi:endonuclease/exonuclease/phosphatase (EEP) superfamily protein YafD